MCKYNKMCNSSQTGVLFDESNILLCDKFDWPLRDATIYLRPALTKKQSMHVGRCQT